MKRIGILFGVENSFPSALVEKINLRNSPGIRAEFVQTGAVECAQPPRYTVLIDRIAHDVPFYRALLKQAVLQGTVVLNDPFRAAADDKFYNYALARRLGVAVPPTVLLPHKQLPNGTSSQSMRNLEFPLDWESVFAAIGEHGFLKPIDGGGGRDVCEVRSREEFFRAYDSSRDLCMVYQQAIEYGEYFRCFVVGRKRARTMPYDPRLPHAERYLKDAARPRTLHARLLWRKMEEDAIRLCRALGYDLNTVEFAVKDGVPCAIDFMNPVPDADVHSVGEEHFSWIVERVADLAISRARSAQPAGLPAKGVPAAAARAKRAQPRTATKSTAHS